MKKAIKEIAPLMIAFALCGFLLSTATDAAVRSCNPKEAAFACGFALFFGYQIPGIK